MSAVASPRRAGPIGSGRDQLRTAGDPELMHAIAGGDLGALGELYDRHRETVHQFLLRATPDRASVEDLVQETFLSAARAAGSYRDQPRAAPFLIAIAAGLARHRRRGLARFYAAIESFTHAYTRPAATPEQEAAGLQDLARVDAALAKLSDDNRLVYLMTEREGLTGEEVAAALGIPVGTVWRRLHDVRGKLQQALMAGDGPSPAGRKR